MSQKATLWMAWSLIVLTITACDLRGGTPEPLPTRIPSVEALATSEFLTQNAPPAGFRDGLTFAKIDDQLQPLSSWHYEAVMQFDGVFSRTPREVDAAASANVWYEQLGRQRRVVIEGAGALFGQEDVTELEGVRMGDNTFLVRDHVCAAVNTDQTTLMADLRGGDLIGGVSNALPDGHHATINGEEVWRYTFTLDDLDLPQIQSNADSKIVLTGGELWVAPERNAVIRFYVNLDVENIVLLFVDNTLPLTGTLILRYDLIEIGADPNISEPYGCQEIDDE